MPIFFPFFMLLRLVISMGIAIFSYTYLSMAVGLMGEKPVWLSPWFFRSGPKFPSMPLESVMCGPCLAPLSRVKKTNRQSKGLSPLKMKLGARVTILKQEYISGKF